MLIIVDNKIPAQARKTLSQYGDIVDFSTENICYKAVSGHPDIFLFQYPDGLIAAPNLPPNYKKMLQENKIRFKEGVNRVGEKYPHTAYYNALFSKYGIIHNRKISDPAILAHAKNIIHCNQAYVRCNAIEAGNYIITSDKGIEKTLLKKKINVFYIDPKEIILPGFEHGFFGGCCGVWDSKFFVCGSLKYMAQGKQLRNLLSEQKFEIVELYDGKLFDIGSILFLDNH